jgi:hypothetical protein
MSDAFPKRRGPDKPAARHLGPAHSANSCAGLPTRAGIARLIQQQSEDVFLVDHGSLYLALQRLEEKSLVQAKWGISENNRKARFIRSPARVKGT